MRINAVEKTRAGRNWDKLQQAVQEASRIFAAGNESLFLFGAGATGALTIPLMREEGAPLTAICDNSAEKQGHMVEGLLCIPPAQLMEYTDPLVLVTTPRYYTSVHHQLEEMKIRHCPVETWLLQRHMEAFREVYDTLEDETSREVFTNVLMYRITGETAYTAACFTDKQYFCFPWFSCLADKKERFVDCGAYVGDVLEQFVENADGVFDRLYAFEPVRRSFSAMEKRVSLLKEIWALSDDQIVCVPCGVGREHRLMEYRCTEYLASTALVERGPSGKESPSEFVEVISLDKYFEQQGIDGITFLKADIEGAEWDMLHGAELLIQRCKPRLAICIYHSAFDLYRIQRYLRQLVPEYHFSIRHHSINHAETVLYCYL